MLNAKKILHDSHTSMCNIQTDCQNQTYCADIKVALSIEGQIHSTLFGGGEDTFV